MTKRTSLVFSANLFLSLLFISCNTDPKIGQSSAASVQKMGELVVAMDVDMPGYFVYEGENYGYQYDLFKAYADHLGVSLRVVDDVASAESGELLDKGNVHITATLTERITSERQISALPVYNTSFVMLTGKKNAASVKKSGDLELIPLLREGKLLVSSGFKVSKAYDELLDSLPGNIYVSGRNSFELVEMLSDGKYDYVICEMSEAHLGGALVKNVEQVYSFNEPASISAVFASNDDELKNDFESWLGKYRNGEDYAMLNYLYFEKGIVAHFMGEGLQNGYKGGISVYDNLIKRICETENYDWRLISAIIYSESRFNPNVVSNRGAQGLMQVMPRVARQFGADGEEIMKPENNILLGVKILGKIESSLKLSPEISDADKLKIILACYNGGIGHVTDARNLARKYGGNPNKWEDVSKYLKLKSDPVYANDEVVRNGSFRSAQTMSFVNEVFTRYVSYCKRF